MDGTYLYTTATSTPTTCRIYETPTSTIVVLKICTLLTYYTFKFNPTKRSCIVNNHDIQLENIKGFIVVNHLITTTYMRYH